MNQLGRPLFDRAFIAWSASTLSKAPFMSRKTPSTYSFLFIPSSMKSLACDKHEAQEEPTRKACWFLCSGQVFISCVSSCHCTILSSALKKKEARVMGLYDLGSDMIFFPGFGRKEILPDLHSFGVYDIATDACMMDMRDRKSVG